MKNANETLREIAAARRPKGQRLGATLLRTPSPIRHAIYYNDPDPAD